MSGCKFGALTRYQSASAEFHQDSWCFLYSYLAKALYERGGFDGEVALRDAIRRYAHDRAHTVRKRLLENNVKINVPTFFIEGLDRPNEARYRNAVFQMNEEERYQEVHVCTFCEMFVKCRAKHLGRIYCEEFHQACYGTFGFEKLRVNLTRTLTQETEDLCSFYLTYRPEYLTEEERRLSFKKYDPGYVDPHYSVKLPNIKVCYAILWIKIYYYMLEAAVDHLGEKGKDYIAGALRECAVFHAEELTKLALSYERKNDKEFVETFLPMLLDVDQEPMWEEYSKNDAKKLIRICFCETLKGELGL